MDEKELMEQEIRNLTCMLTSSNSDIGDWKVIKCLEYKACGKESPYDFEKLTAKRQEVRNRINELQTALAAISDKE